MSADDRIEMDEEMAEFWAEVKDRLPGLLGRDGFVSAYPLADPGDVDITMGSRGVSYPFCAMTSLINAAVSGGREGGDGA